MADALGDVPASLDSVTAREQVVEQWVQRELLVQEARRQGLDQDPTVRRRLAEAERAALELAALDAYFDQAPADPSEAELKAYYDRHRDQLHSPRLAAQRRGSISSHAELLLQAPLPSARALCPCLNMNV